MFLATDLYQTVESAFSLPGRRGGGETGTHARTGIGGQGELADQQQATPGLGQRTVHLSLPVGKNPVPQQALGHADQVGFGIARFYGHQGQEARADRPDGFALDGDAGLGDALDEGEHAGMGV